MPNSWEMGFNDGKQNVASGKWQGAGDRRHEARARTNSCGNRKRDGEQNRNLLSHDIIEKPEAESMYNRVYALLQGVSERINGAGNIEWSSDTEQPSGAL